MNVNHIDRKELKRQARELLKSNWKVLTSVVIISFALLCACVAIGDNISEYLVATIALVLCIPITVMYYKFFIKGVENQKFTFKDLKPNLRSCFAIFKLIMFLVVIYILIIALIFLVLSALISNNIIEFNRNTVLMCIIGYLVIEILVCIISILLSIYFAFTYMYIIDKNIDSKIGIFKGIKNSYKLMKGYRLKYIEIALSFIGYWIIVIVPNILFVIFTKTSEITSTVFLGLMILIVWDVLGSLLLSIYFMVCKTLLYKELKKRFEDIEN